MKIGMSNTTTCHIRNHKISYAYMMDNCLAYCNGGDNSEAEAEKLFKGWCEEIDTSLEGTGFSHSPHTSEVIGPIDGEIDSDEFSEIMETAAEKAVKKLWP